MNYLFLICMMTLCSLQAMDSQSESSTQNSVDSSSNEHSVQEYKERRQRLLQRIRDKYKQAGPVILVSSFEKDGEIFRQESMFYYLTGFSDSAAALIFDEQETVLFTHDDTIVHTQWFDHGITQAATDALGIQKIERFGETKKFTTFPFESRQTYRNLTEHLKKHCDANKKIYAINSSTYGHHAEHVAALRNIFSFVHSPMNEVVQDVYEDVVSLRKQKSPAEIEKIKVAINLTEKAFRILFQKIKPGITEADVLAKIMSVFIKGAQVHQAYQPVVGTGANACILHHNPSNTAYLKVGDLVLIDAGAELNMYCADITRTLPVSGTFTERQKEIYSIVLQTQEYVAQHARPGKYLRKRENPEESLYLLAQKILEEKGNYQNNMIHGIGHHVGLDVHDVGSFDSLPLEEGNIITIEPGIYLPEENIGIRIEDNYLITKDGAICLSANIPKTIEEIELLMKQKVTSSSSTGVKRKTEYRELDQDILKKHKEDE